MVQAGLKTTTAILVLVLLLSVSPGRLVAADLQPLMCEVDQVVLREDFSRPTATPDKSVWKPRQGTRWAFADGVLRGRPSTAEYQAKRRDHKGLEPRLSISKCPAEFVIAFSLRLLDGEASAIVPFVEFGHHVARVNWDAAGVRLVADHESVQLADAPGFHLQPGTWCHALAEIQGDEFVIQFADGPVLQGRHEAFRGEKDGFGVAGLRGGVIELDDVTVWSVKPAKKPTWANTRAKLPASQPRALAKPVRGKKK